MWAAHRMVNNCCFHSVRSARHTFKTSRSTPMLLCDFVTTLSTAECRLRGSKMTQRHCVMTRSRLSVWRNKVVAERCFRCGDVAQSLRETTQNKSFILKRNLSSFVHCSRSRSSRFTHPTAFDAIEAFLKKHFEALPAGMGELPTTALTEPTHIICISLVSAENNNSPALSLPRPRIIDTHTCRVHVPPSGGRTHLGVQAPRSLSAASGVSDKQSGEKASLSCNSNITKRTLLS